MSERKPELRDVPSKITNPKTSNVFVKGRFLGKGGFARCYELLDEKSTVVYAGKVISKTLLTKKHQRDKVAQEIKIHNGLNHPHIVRFFSHFEDADNVYILLELCARRSLMELHKRRKIVTEPESRYFMVQIVEATAYLHGSRIIHRDLKLGNLFLDDDMNVKIGDFGLATKVNYEGERKKTLCGTPNYIAPEMLDKRGHSYEVDIWSIGCILYTLLVGKPPFETSSLKETYSKIKTNDYGIPYRLPAYTAKLISRLLASDPSKRPTIKEVLADEFFHAGYTPSRLPTTCLTTAPKFVKTPQKTMSPAKSVEGQTESGDVAMEVVAPARVVFSPLTRNVLGAWRNPLPPTPEGKVIDFHAQMPVEPDANCDPPSDCYLCDLYGQLTDFINSAPKDALQCLEDAEHPASSPVFWVSKWVDYSDKYGLGYQLCDNSVGVVFNDNTKIVLSARGGQVQYIEKSNAEHFFTLETYPPDLQKKLTLLQYFRSYMNDFLQKTGADVAAMREGDEIARLPCLRTWFRTDNAIVLHLSNGTLQINFFQDHTKIILCPLLSVVTYIDEQRVFRVYKFDLLRKIGCPSYVLHRLKYARVMVGRLLSQSSQSQPGSLSTAVNPIIAGRAV